MIKSFIHGKIISARLSGNGAEGQLCLSGTGDILDFHLKNGSIPGIGLEIIVDGDVNHKSDLISIENSSDIFTLPVEDFSWLDSIDEHVESLPDETVEQDVQENVEDTLSPRERALQMTNKLFEPSNNTKSAVPPEMAGMFRSKYATFGSRGNLLLYPDEMDLQIMRILKKEQEISSSDLENGSNGDFKDLFGSEWTEKFIEPKAA